MSPTQQRAIAPELPPELLIDDDVTTRRLLGGISRSVHYVGMKSGRYSKPVKVAPNTNGFVRARTLADLAKIIAESDAAEAKKAARKVRA